MYVNLYVTVPAGDHGKDIGTAISNGPATLSVHAVLGILLILAAIGLLVQALIARHWAVLTAAAIALIAIIGAAVEGARFAAQAPADASMTMALLTGVAMLCYGLALYLLPSPRQAGQAGQAETKLER
jgi:vacuolar-type H+-ATPase subunit I/STV1